MDRSDILFSQANELLTAAEHEQDRASEDVVTHLICTNSRQSLSNYLAGYILRRQIPVHHPVSLYSLLEQCKTLDARFETLDLTQMNCRFANHDRDYCLEYDQVEQCIKVAQQARDIVMAETPPY